MLRRARDGRRGTRDAVRGALACCEARENLAQVLALAVEAGLVAPEQLLLPLDKRPEALGHRHVEKPWTHLRVKKVQQDVRDMIQRKISREKVQETLQDPADEQDRLSCWSYCNTWLSSKWMRVICAAGSRRPEGDGTSVMLQHDEKSVTSTVRP